MEEYDGNGNGNGNDNNNDKSKGKMRGFFAALRMTKGFWVAWRRTTATATAKVKKRKGLRVVLSALLSFL